MGDIKDLVGFYRESIETQLTNAIVSHENNNETNNLLENYGKQREEVREQIKNITNSLHRSIDKQAERLMEQLETAFQRCTGGKSFEDMQAQVKNSKYSSIN